MKLEELRSLVDGMTTPLWEAYAAPCCPDMGGISAGTRRPVEACIGRYGHPMELRDAEAIAALANHAGALLDLAFAVQQRLEARCWSVSEHETERRKFCWCGDYDAIAGCPVGKADLAIYACYRELEAVPNE